MDTSHIPEEVGYKKQFENKLINLYWVIHTLILVNRKLKVIQKRSNGGSSLFCCGLKITIFKDSELISYNYFQCGSLPVVEVNDKLKINQSVYCTVIYFGCFSYQPAIDMNT